MRKIIQTVLIFTVICNAIIATLLTIIGINSNTYFREYDNLRSLKNKESYMIDDFLVIKRIYKDTGTGEGESLSYTVEGTTTNNNSFVRLEVSKLEYLSNNHEKQPLYKSKLTGDYFLKNAPQGYYNAEMRSFYVNIYFKISFYIIIAIMGYLLIVYLKNRKYRI
ncbi:MULTISPECIES: hypothetical protein [Flavobacterium]|uniref:hypothetical protein n=1 Tax=Flavobacterium TaxID=237 RepID=UPI0011821F3E|nr:MULTISPECIES: hypothetical protein [Flavobacterium]MCR4031516.1 hypothetical protein [Flavobacterium panacis]